MTARVSRLVAALLLLFVASPEARASRLRVQPGTLIVMSFNAGITRVPLEFVSRLPVVAAEIEFASRRPVTARLMLDTGASQTVMLRQPFAAAHRLLELAPAGEAHTASSLASGTLQLVRLPAQRLRFALWTFENPFIRAHKEPVGSGGYVETDGVLGNELLRRFRVTIDYSRRVMTLEPNGALDEPFRR